MSTSTTTDHNSPERRMFAPELREIAAETTPAGNPTAAARRATSELAYRKARKASPAPAAASPAPTPKVAAEPTTADIVASILLDARREARRVAKDAAGKACDADESLRFVPTKIRLERECLAKVPTAAEVLALVTGK